MPRTAQNVIRSLHREGTTPVGTLITCQDPISTAIAGSVGFDYVLIDMEHGPITVETVVRHILAARAYGMFVFVRVLENRPQLVQAAMDAGADGVIAPKVETAQDADRLAAAVRYAPGGRGACPGTLGADFSFEGWDDYRSTTNANVLAIPLIETQKGVVNAQSIAEVDGVDAVFFGPVDYAQDVGTHYLGPDVVQAARQVASAAKSADKMMMLTLAGHFTDIHSDLILESADMMLLRAAFEDALRVHRGGR